MSYLGLEWHTFYIAWHLILKMQSVSTNPSMIRSVTVVSNTGACEDWCCNTCTFTDLNISTNINTQNAKLQMVRIHTKHITCISLLHTTTQCSIISLCNIRHRHNKLHTTHHQHTIYSKMMWMYTWHSGTHTLMITKIDLHHHQQL